MAGTTFNIAKGREVGFYDRVDSNDPANSALVFVVLATGGDTIYQLRAYDTLAAVLAGPSAEVTNAGYSRKVLTDSDLAAWSPDDTNNRIILTLPLQTFSSITAGDTWDIVLVCYDSDTTSGTDANIVPITASELRIDGTAIPTLGDDIVVDFSSGWTIST